MARRTIGRPAARWAAPVAAIAVVAAVAVGTSAAAAASADARPDLPPRSAEQLLVDVTQPGVTALSGTVALHADLGLPELPALGGGPGGSGVVPDDAASLATDAAGGSLSPALAVLTDLLTGDHTLRVWADAPDRARVAVIADGEETDLVKAGSDVWLWQSDGRRAFHATLPDLPAPDEATLPDEGALDLFGKPLDLSDLPATPQEAAQRLLAAADPSTAVTSDETATVAGRAAYLLTATPRDEGTLVDRIVVAVDAETHAVLRAEAWSTRLATPALSVGFTSVSFATPPAGVFAFAPPAGTAVTEVPDDLAGLAGDGDLPQRPTQPGADGATSPTHPDVTTVGEGWATVVVLTPPAGQAQAMLLGSGDASFGWGDGDSDPASGAAGILATLPQVSGPWGSGRALAGTLFSVLVADDGRVAVGAVPVAALEDALAGTTP